MRGAERVMMMIGGLLFWAFLGTWLFLIRPGSVFHKTEAIRLTGKRKLFLVLLLAGIIALLGFLMTLSPYWNGEIPEHRNQYEVITEAFLEGRLDFGYEVDPRLPELENPYDKTQWKALGIDVHFDHAFYQGKYYMYFGVVPVFLAFLPYRLITGHALVSWQATLLFTAGFVIGLACLLYRLMKRFFPKISWAAFLSLLTAFALAGSLYEAMFPALYHTPVACGMMLAVWSLYCYVKAFCRDPSGDFSLGPAALGALLGALIFGCRPTLAMVNLMVIPLAVRFLRGRKLTARTALRLVAAAVPYALVAAALMWYNAARFQNPFEFGQSYQMTVVDQTSYSSMFTLENLVKIPAGLFNALFVVSPVDTVFPFLRPGNGAFAVCPLLLLCFAFLFRQPRTELKEKQLFGLSVTAVLASLLIIALQIAWSPWLLDRYQSDYVYLLGIGAFCGAGACFARSSNRPKLSWLISLAAFGCVLLTALVFLIPSDQNYTAYDPAALTRIWNFITFKVIR